MAESLKSIMGCGRVVLEHPLQSPSRAGSSYKPIGELVSLGEVDQHQHHVEAEALIAAAAKASSGDKAKGVRK